MTARFIQIVNWETFQHYKDRNPPWIKLHRELLTSETWVSSSNEDRVLAIAIMMLAAECGNRVSANPRYIQRRAYLEKEPDLSGLIMLKFIEIIEENDDASKSLASARPEKETENREEDSVANATGAEAPKLPTAIDLKAAVFSSGVPLLMGAGITEKNARSMLGRWRSDYGDGAVLDALSSATAESPSEPIPWIRRTLEARNGRQPNNQRGLQGSRPSPALAMRRQAQAELAAESARGDQEHGGGPWPPLPAIGTG